MGSAATHTAGSAESQTLPLARETVAGAIEGLTALDTVSGPVKKAAGAIVPQGSRLKDLLSGTWLGHPVHPPLTDVVIGSWTGALFLDLLGGADSEQASERLIAAGIVAAVPTAAAGLSDWADTQGAAGRVGTVHAVGNSTALVLHALSWVARRRGDRRRGMTLSMAGYGIATFSAWLGGHLTFALGVGVDQNAFDDAPSDWTPVLGEDDLEDGTLAGAQADGVGVLLARQGGQVYALADRCSHRGCSLHEGELRGDTVVCRCHGSTFRLADGSVVRGPATAPQPAFDVRTRDGAVQIRRRQEA